MSLALSASRVAPSRRSTLARAKKQSTTPRIVSERGRRVETSPADEKPTPLSEEKLRSLPPEMLRDDPWANESFDALGNVASGGLIVVAVIAAIAGAYATSTYNEGAVEVDFQSYASPEEAVADSLRRVNAVERARAVEAPDVSVTEQGSVE